MRNPFKNKKIFLFLTIFLLFLSLSSKAQVDCGANCATCYDKSSCNADLDCGWESVLSKCCQRLEVRWPDSPTGTSISGCTTVTGMVKYFYEWGIALGGLATFFALVMGGFQYLTSMGEPAKITEAKGRIQSAVYGLVLLLGAWLILNTINPELTKFKADLHLTRISPPEEGLGKAELTPCEFAYGYKQIDWIGTATKIDITSSPTNFQDLKSYVIYRQREITTIKCNPNSPPETTACTKLDGDYLCTEYDKKKTETDKKEVRKYLCVPKDSEYYELEPCDTQTEHCCDASTTPSCSGYYKAGGACVLEFYYQSSWWVFPTGGCGDKMGSVGASSVADLSAYIPNYASTYCVRLVEIKTKK